MNWYNDGMERKGSRTAWLPITRDELPALGWDTPDVVLVTGDAYVDHPAFGTAVIGRVLEQAGVRVAVIPQPNWRDDLRDFRKFGRPRLFFGVTSGNMDSMMNHYTAHRRRRADDAYTPGGAAGFRPDRAVTVYTKILKSLYPDVPVVLGGIEASLRRLTHYDYWSDGLRPSVLQESGADLLVHGMGEEAIRRIAELLMRGVPFSSLKTIPQTAFLMAADEPLPKNSRWETLALPSHEECAGDKKEFLKSFKLFETESNRLNARRLTQRLADRRIVVNPPFPPPSAKELDAIYDLPFTRLPHPKYQKRGPVPAFEMIKFSITLHRGCFGGCAFCTISAHQGKWISSRSKESVVREAGAVADMPGFAGVISDLGGPTANMYGMRGKDTALCAHCARSSCLFPAICENLNTSHAALLELYRAVEGHSKVKKAFVSSGVRHDLALKDESYRETLAARHVSGRLKLAPEHTEERVLKLMRKPSFEAFLKFKKWFDGFCARRGLRQEILPYFISSHPGGTEEDMARLAVRTKELGYRLEQVQDFTPTPLTLASVIYYTGLDPDTLKPVPVARAPQEKKAQKDFFFWHKPEMRAVLKRALLRLGRGDLIRRLFG